MQPDNKITLKIKGEDKDGWVFDLSGLPQEVMEIFNKTDQDGNYLNQTIEDIELRRQDGRFFSVQFTHELGYGFPMIFQTLNQAKTISGNICLVVRRDPNGKWFVAIERKKYLNFKREVKECVRAFRSSISAPEGSPVPKGTKRYAIKEQSIIELDNMRIGGPTATYVVRQRWDDPLEHNGKKFELMSFIEFAKTDDAPGKAVLGEFLLKKGK